MWNPPWTTRCPMPLNGSIAEAIAQPVDHLIDGLAVVTGLDGQVIDRSAQALGAHRRIGLADALDFAAENLFAEVRRIRTQRI